MKMKVTKSTPNFHQMWTAEDAGDGILRPGHCISGTGIGWGEHFDFVSQESLERVARDTAEHFGHITLGQPVFHLWGYFELDDGQRSVNEG